MEANTSIIELTQDDLDTIEIAPSSVPKIDPKAFHGILNDFIITAVENSEASSVAVAANVICFISTIIGRRAVYYAGDISIHARPFILIIGKSGRARKGSAEGLPRRVFKRVDEIMQGKDPFYPPLNIHAGGLSSGEGIAYAIRDESTDKDKSDPGVPDKRLLVIESEFANVLANCKRESSTLSSVLRNVFDGRTLSPLTKSNRTVATDPHVVIMAHITANELLQKAKLLEISNGLMNRFLMLHVERDQLKPLPERTSNEAINTLASKLVEVIEFIEAQSGGVNEGVQVTLSEEARLTWAAIYSEVSKDRSGSVGELSARFEYYALMLAMIFALLDKQIVIQVMHLKAALSWIEYAEATLCYLFQSEEESELESFSEEILCMLKQRGELTRTAINKNLNGHQSSKDIINALEHLLNQMPPKISQRKAETAGRPKFIFKYIGDEKED